MKKIRLSDLIWIIIFLGLIITPIFNFGEIVSLFSGTMVSQSVAVTPIYIKIIKDVMFIIMILLSLLALLKRGTSSYFIVPYFIFFGFVCLLFYKSYVLTSPLIAVAGVRWIMPIALSFFLIGYVKDETQEKIAKIIALLLVVQVSAQIYELFYMGHWFGRNIFGLSGRVPGMFFMPNTAGFFSCLAFYYISYFMKKGWLKSIFLYLIIPISVYLTMSGTALLVYLIIIMIRLINRSYIRGLILIVPIIMLAVMPLVISLSGRGANYFDISFGTRLQIFMNYFLQPTLISDVFGAGTEAAALISNTLGLELLSLQSESIYAGFMVNMGLLFFIVFLILYLLWCLIMIKVNRKDLYTFTVIFTIFGVSNPILGAYPMNLLFAVTLAYYIKKIYQPLIFKVKTMPAPIAGTV